jgi:hypothetical protein
MIVGFDSAFPPSPDTALAAKAAGVKLWSGYISTAPYDGGSHFNLYHPWPLEAFEYARLCGADPIAFCSGWDDPVALRQLAAAHRLKLCLDVEGGIRGNGPWVQAFLDPGRRAAFYIVCAYLGAGDPGSTWWDAQVARPAGPCGYQWIGTHTEFGVSVDRGNYDDAFLSGFGASGGSMTDAELRFEHDIAQLFCWGIVDTSEQSYKDYVWARQHGMSFAAAIAGWKNNDAGKAWQAKLAGMNQPPPAPGTADHKAVLDAIAAETSVDNVILNSVGAIGLEIKAIRAKIDKDLA